MSVNNWVFMQHEQAYVPGSHLSAISMHTLALQALYFESLCTGIWGKFEFNVNWNNDTQTIYRNTQPKKRNKLQEILRLGNTGNGWQAFFSKVAWCWQWQLFIPYRVRNRKLAACVYFRSRFLYEFKIAINGAQLKNV